MIIELEPFRVLNPFEVREVSKHHPVWQRGTTRLVLIPLKSGKFLNPEAEETAKAEKS